MVFLIIQKMREKWVKISYGTIKWVYKTFAKIKAVWVCVNKLLQANFV